MKLFLDEDIGTRVPRALRELGLAERVDFVSRNSPIRKGTPDEDWIPIVSRTESLLLSCNKAILSSPAQRELLVSSNAGAVFFTTGQMRTLEIMMLILRKWDWLNDIDVSTARPFAFMLTRRGRTHRVL